jgi:hypothetical protein
MEQLHLPDLTVKFDRIVKNLRNAPMTRESLTLAKSAVHQICLGLKRTLHANIDTQHNAWNQTEALQREWTGKKAAFEAMQPTVQATFARRKPRERVKFVIGDQEYSLDRARLEKGYVDDVNFFTNAVHFHPDLNTFTVAERSTDMLYTLMNYVNTGELHFELNQLLALNEQFDFYQVAQPLEVQVRPCQGELVRTLSLAAVPRMERIRKMELSPQGHLYLGFVCRLDFNGEQQLGFSVWNVMNGEPIEEIRLPPSKRLIEMAGFGVSERAIVTGRRESLSLWDLKGHPMPTAMKSTTARLYYCNMSPAGSIHTFGQVGNHDIYEITHYNAVGEMERSKQVTLPEDTCGSIDAMGWVIAHSREAQSIRVLNPEGVEVYRIPHDKFDDLVTCISEDRKYLITASRIYLRPNPDGAKPTILVQRYALETGHLETEWSPLVVPGSMPVDMLSVPGGGILLGTSDEIGLYFTANFRHFDHILYFK